MYKAAGSSGSNEAGKVGSGAPVVEERDSCGGPRGCGSYQNNFPRQVISVMLPSFLVSRV